MTMKLIRNIAATVSAGILAASIASTAVAAEGKVPSGVSHLDHVFVIMMENHTFQQIAANPAMPYINGLLKSDDVGVARNYFAVGHPSLTNYLEIVGGSNFGVRSDNNPDWHNGSCVPNLQSGLVNADNAGQNAPVKVDPSGSVCPIAGVGTDAATEAVDNWNEIAPGTFNFLANIDGIKWVPAAKNTVGKTIGDQLAHAGLSYKSYQESLPLSGTDKVNASNGTATDATTYLATKPASFTNLTPMATDSGNPGKAPLVNEYAVKHNPFAYFRSTQEGNVWSGNSLANTVGFDGSNGLYADLNSGDVPSLAFIVPNQCDDQHGRGNGDLFCQFDQGIDALDGLTDGSQMGLNAGLSAQADAMLKRLVTAIKASPTWHRGNNAIVIVWDENDYSGVLNSVPTNTAFPAQNQNEVVLTVETSNHSNHGGVQSKQFYNSYSLLKSMEAGFHLPCLNHACDNDVAVMSDLFGADHDRY